MAAESQPRACRVCMLGGGLSALAAIEQLKQTQSGLEIDVFCELYDPCEPNHSYGFARKPYVDYMPAFLAADGPEFASQLQEWERQGLLLRCSKDSVIELGGAGGHNDNNQRFTQRQRYTGATQLCRQLLKKHATSSAGTVRVRAEQPWAISATCQGGWLVSLGKAPQEHYHFVLLAYDFCYRLTHVKAIRELLDSGMPHTRKLIGCFGELHAAKCLALTFSVEPPLGQSVTWDAVLVHDNPLLRWAFRSHHCETAVWQRPSGAEHWVLISTSEHSQKRFGVRWDKQQAGQEMLDMFAKVAGVDITERRVKFVGNPYHWDLPAPRNRPKGQLGLLADAKHAIGWTGDFCVEPTPEGCWLAGNRAGRILAGALKSNGRVDFGQLSDRELLPPWEYHPVRFGDEDLAALTFSAAPATSAYRGTCNWERAEEIMMDRLKVGELADSDHVWLDHLPKSAQQQFARKRKQMIPSSTVSSQQPEVPRARDHSVLCAVAEAATPIVAQSLRVAVVGSGPAGFFLC